MSLGKGQNSASILLAASALGFSCDVQKHLPVKVLTSTNASDGNGRVPAIVLPHAQDSGEELLRNRRKPLKGSLRDMRLIET